MCLADLNADTIVDRADLDRLLRFYGACRGCKEDLNQDNFVDDLDVAIVIQQWGPCRPEGDVFGGDHSGDSLVGRSDTLADDADSLSGPDMDRTTTTLAPTRCRGAVNAHTVADAADIGPLQRSYGACCSCAARPTKDGCGD